jgi:hypothetical protein
MLGGFTRLVVVCGRAIGRFRDGPLDLSNDGFLLPGTLLAMFVLGFYPGDLEERKTLAFAILGTAVSWGLVAEWLRRRREAGPLYLALRTLLPVVIAIGSFISLLVVQDAEGIIQAFGQSGDPLVTVCSRINALTASIFLFLILTVGIEIREQGCVTFFRFIRWEEIESYNWMPGRPENLFLRLKLRNSPLLLTKMINPRRKDEVDRVLSGRLPQVEQGFPVRGGTLEAPELQDRKPAERLEIPVIFLLVSGVMQFGLAGFFEYWWARDLMLNPNFTRELEISETTALLVLFLLTASALSGIMIIWGAVKMHKLKAYRFCRMISILAMLPLGFGVVFGLPFGVWSLLVLRRPDVKAAFAENDGIR